MNGFSEGLSYIDKIRNKQKSDKGKFLDLYRHLEKKARIQGVPICGHFELTPLCNFDCKMCYVHLRPDQMKEKTLSVGEWKYIMREACDQGMMYASLTGGECLTYPGFDEIIIHLHNMGCQTSVLTNGYLLDQGWIGFFQKHPVSKLQVTLYGSSENAYERVTGKRVYTKVLENVLEAKRVGIPVHVSITPSMYSVDDTFEIINIAKKNDLPFVINNALFRPRIETGREGIIPDISNEDYARIYHYLQEMEGNVIENVDECLLPPIGSDIHDTSERGILCGAGRSNFSIDWHGIMHPCNSLLTIASHPLVIGFKKAWKQVNEAANNWPRIPECTNCAYKGVCWQCAANLMEFTVPGKQPIEWCKQTQYYVKHGVYQLPNCE